MADRKARLVWLSLVGWVLLLGTLPAVFAGGRANAHRDANLDPNLDPNVACAGCHKDIYERYRTTPMARASGRAADGFMPGSYTSAASGVTYTISERDSRPESEKQVWLGFERAILAGVADASHALKGERELRYFLGSGTRGRTYLFEQDGYWFEIPINWYAKKRVWEMAPNYAHAPEAPLTMPVDPGCLRCHSSGAQASLPEARNRYAGAPFLEGGITCVACHESKPGEAAAHVASGGRASLLRIEGLEPVRRDSICLSCHLEGDEAVVHLGKRLVDFRPGESVFDYASYFVAAERPSPGRRATSQWEALLRSGCKRGAGDALTCTSCHDPHASTVGMGTAERVAFYRAKCLACHEGSGGGGVSGVSVAGSAVRFGALHHPEQQDCAACHMPRATANDIAHEQVTDHAIPRVPGVAAQVQRADGAGVGGLMAVGSSVGVAGTASGRDLGLAYALAGSRGDRAAGERALVLLREAESLPEREPDPELHEQLGFLEQRSGDQAGAAREYGLALAADPHDSVAAGNLALLKAGDREYGAAIELWERAFGEDPVQLKAGMNLALVDCGVGRKEAALAVLDRMLRFSPDDGAARELARGIRAGTHGCGK